MTGNTLSVFQIIFDNGTARIERDVIWKYHNCDLKEHISVGMYYIFKVRFYTINDFTTNSPSKKISKYVDFK